MREKKTVDCSAAWAVMFILFIYIAVILILVIDALMEQDIPILLSVFVGGFSMILAVRLTGSKNLFIHK